MEPVRVYAKSPDVGSNKDDEGWRLVTRKKKAMRRNSWRAHKRAPKILDGKQGAIKQVKKPLKEDFFHQFSFPTLETNSFSLDGLKMLQLLLICRRSLLDLSLNGSKVRRECSFSKLPRKVVVQFLILADMGHKVLNSSAQRRRVKSIEFNRSK
ncbi:hypothetical protein ACH5RR_009235 [Cinchona calisaya]|uniref:Uncharacterized protein n=1 Tax=Cinchona calisaya TaxID=153742 RepID=A0ABD3AFJ8_9GENT